MDDIKKLVIDNFKNKFGISPVATALAPGRLEILGNHTDYNEGFVLSAATNLYTVCSIAPAEGNICTLYSFDIDSNNDLKSTFSIDSLSSPVPGEWSNYVKGVAYEISKLVPNNNIPAFNVGIMSTVPLSAGMSSSAALEVAAGFAFGEMCGVKLLPEEWAKLGQSVENNYLGLKSGLLDQFSSIFGEKDSLIFCDFREVKVLKTVSLSDDYVFIVANSMVKHNLVDSDYNVRRESCEKAVEAIKHKFPEVKALRDVSYKMLEESRDLIDFIDYKRALHVVGENSRVLAGVEALGNNDIELFGSLMFESHQSSKENFANSCTELDYLVELGKTLPGCIGARLSGGGFGGISIHLVKKDRAEEYKNRLFTAYKIQTGIESPVLICQAGDGAEVL